MQSSLLRKDLGLWRPGDDSSYVSGAFRALLQHIYTGRRQVEVDGLKGSRAVEGNAKTRPNRPQFSNFTMSF